jgi:hypothetical protein
MRKGRIGMLIGSLLFALSPASAQDRESANPDSAPVEQFLHLKDKLIVTSEDGTRTKGRLVEMSAGRIVLRQRGGNRSIPTLQITQVQRRRNRLWLGGLIGAGASIPLALVARVYLNNEVGGGGAAAAKIICVGALAGVGVNALVSVPRTVYRRQAAKGLTVQPILGRHDMGMRFALTF